MSRSKFAREGLRHVLESSEIRMDVQTGSEPFELLSEALQVVVLNFSETLFSDFIAVLDSKEIGLVLIGGAPETEASINRDSRITGYAILAQEANDETIIAAVIGCAAGLILRERPGNADRSVSGVRLPVDVTPLTDREKEILQLMSEGHANKMIATHLSLSVHTVKFHIASILLKLNATSRTEAVTIGIRNGYVLI